MPVEILVFNLVVVISSDSNIVSNKLEICIGVGASDVFLFTRIQRS